MNRYTPFWIVVQLIFAASAWSEDCSPVRLDVTGGSMEHVYGRGQEFGTCYAESASELYDAWRFSHGETNHEDASSALELAIQYSKKYDHDGFDRGGTLDRALKILGNKGACSEKAINAKLTNLTSKQYASLAASLQRKHWEQFNERRMRTVPPASRMDGYAALAEQQRRSMDYAQFQLENYLLLQELEKLSSIPEGQTPSIRPNKPALFEQTAAFYCEDYDRMISPEKFDIVSKSDSSQRPRFKTQFREAVDSNFAQPLETAQPVAISYCGSLLEMGRAYLNKLPSPGSELCGGHGSVILGRRMNPESGRCQYLVLNSWDATSAATIYHTDWEVTSSGYHLWIDRNAVEAATFGYTYLKPARYR